MFNLKTKSDKHANDNEKRCKSIKIKEKIKKNQSKIIKEALLHSSLNNDSSKKIVFNNDNDACGDDKKNDKSDEHSSCKYSLFENSDSENENLEIKEKIQFKGKKGFELLSLQSTYGNDDRFKIDERFLEAEPDEVNEEKENENNKADVFEEKTKQLKILESVLGTSLVRPEEEKKKSKRIYEMIRYDVSNKDHEIYEKKRSEAESLIPHKKKKEKRKIETTDKEVCQSLTKMSKNKFYKVSNEMKNCLKEKQDGCAPFSLLKTYGLNDSKRDQEVHEEEVERIKEENYEKSVVMDYNEVECDFEEAIQKKEETNVKIPEKEEKSVVAKGIWKEFFFFVQDDLRFKEGLEFINKKGSPEADKAAENYNKTRKTLKEIFRLHLKKQMHKKDPFKNKIGGMNKKQLANLRFKTPKTMLNKRTTQKKNCGMTI